MASTHCSTPQESSTPHELQEKLKRRDSISGSVRVLFGREPVQHFQDFLTSDRVVEIDVLRQVCQMSDEEFVQYRALLPEEAEQRAEIQSIGIQFIEYLKPKLEEIAKNSIKGEKKNSIPYVHHQIGLLLRNISCFAPYRLTLMEEFHKAILIAFFREIEKIFQLPQYKPYSSVPVRFRKKINAEWEQQYGISYFPSFYFSTRNRAQLCLTNGRFRSNFNKAYPPVTEIEGVENELREQFEKIKKYAQYRKILFTSWEYDMAPEVKAAIMGDETIIIPGSNPDICNGTIILNPLEDLILPKIEKNKVGREFISIKERDGVINFALNKMTGEIGYWGISPIPLSDVIPQAQYLALKRDIYQHLFHYLTSKDPDIEDLFAKHTPLEPSPRKVQEDTHTIVEASLEPEGEKVEVISDEITPDLVDEVVEVLEEFPEIEKGTGAPATVFPEEESVDHKEKYRYLRQLKGLKGRRALRGLIKLLGHPYSIQGSHYMFRSPRNGKILPFPIHFNKEITFPIFVSNLQALAYGLEELCEKL